jgi:hypothetical protein
MFCVVSLSCSAVNTVHSLSITCSLQMYRFDEVKDSVGNFKLLYELACM